MKNIVYRFSKSFFLTKHITKRIEGKLLILYPSNKGSIINKTASCLIRLYIISLIVISGLLMFSRVSLYYTIVVGIIVYFVADEKLNEEFNQMEYRLLEQLLKFVEEIRFRFQFDGMLERAIIETINEADYEISVHGQKIYECLMESYYHEKQEYIDISPNHFFLTFYSLCETVLLYGDKKQEGASIFLKNLGYLKEEINIELLKRSKISGNFLGLKTIAILPLFAIGPIEKWATFNIPQLKDSYSGQIGIYTTIGLALISIMSYKMVNILKSGAKQRHSSNIIKNLCNKNIIKFLIRKYIAINIKSSNNIHNILNDIAYEYDIFEYTLKRFVTAFIAMAIAVIFAISGYKVSDKAVAEIYLYIVGVAIVGIIAFFLPVLSLKLKKAIILMDREEEVVRFQNIILMMMYIDKVTVEQIIVEMERFSYVFKRVLWDITNKYTYKGTNAFKTAKEEVRFRPFERLMEGFIACDDTYIYKAFEDLEKDRQYFLDRHKQENERIIQDKTVIAKLISFIPLCLVIIVKLIVPFVIYGIGTLNQANFLT